jgi:hypothetical protein
MHIRIAVLVLGAGITQAQSDPTAAALSLEQPAYVNGPVWIHIQALRPDGYVYVGYPVGIAPGDFGCHDVQVRRRGTTLPRIPQSPSIGASSQGLLCGSIGLPGREIGHQNRLPLHLWYRFDKPGAYEVKYTGWRAIAGPPGAPRQVSAETAWTRIEIQPAKLWKPRPPPQDPAEAISDYLPSILGFPDDAHLRLVIEYLYHPNETVRRYDALGLDYWPEDEVDHVLIELLHTRGPSDVLVERTIRSPGAVDFILPHLRSSDPVLLRGAIIATSRLLFYEPPLLSANDRARAEDTLISAADNVLRDGNPQTGNYYATALGSAHDPRARTVLWSFVDRNVLTEQSLTAITWSKNLADLPRLAALIESPSHGDPMQTTYGLLPYAIHRAYGDAAVPVLKLAMEKSGFVWVRTACADELVLEGEKSGYEFIAQYIEQNKPYRGEMVRFLRERFPELRDADDDQVLAFLKSH